MNGQQSAFGDLLDDVAKAVRNMSDAEFERFVKGELRPSITFKACSSGGKSRKLSPSISEEELNDIQTKLNTVRTREEGYRIVEEAFPLKEHLFAFAKFRIYRFRKRTGPKGFGRKSLPPRSAGG